MFVRFLCCMLRPSPSYSFLSQHASYWKVKPIFLHDKQRHFIACFASYCNVKWPISHDESTLSVLYDGRTQVIFSFLLPNFLSEST